MLSSLPVSEIIATPRKSKLLSKRSLSAVSTPTSLHLNFSPVQLPINTNQLQNTPQSSNKSKLKSLKRAASELPKTSSSAAKKQKTFSQLASPELSSNAFSDMDFHQQSLIAALKLNNELLTSKVEKLTCQLETSTAAVEQYKMIANSVKELQLQSNNQQQLISQQQQKTEELKTINKEQKREIKALNKQIKSQQKQTKSIYHSPPTEELIENHSQHPDSNKHTSSH